jgi:RimJ/RimL family protein N-acetyltransferase
MKVKSRIYYEKYLSENDFSYYLNLTSDEKTMKMNFGRIFTVEESRKLFNNILEVNKKHIDFGHFKVFEASTNNYMGLCAIIPNDDFTEVEIEYMLLPNYWGSGYGSEIVEVLLHKSNNIKSIKQVVAYVDPNNIASKKILLKRGFSSDKIYEIDDGSLVERLIKDI